MAVVVFTVVTFSDVVFGVGVTDVLPERFEVVIGNVDGVDADGVDAGRVDAFKVDAGGVDVGKVETVALLGS